MKTKIEGNKFWKIAAIISFICAFIPLYFGFDKMFNYNSGEYFGDPVNAYVGGDAYNYIINGTHSTSFFVLSAILVIMSIGFAILYYMSRNEEAIYLISSKIDDVIPAKQEDNKL